MSKVKKTSILEEAYEEAKALELELKENAKDILSTTMKGDLEELVKESLDDDVEDVEDDVEDVEDDVEYNISDLDLDDLDYDSEEETVVNDTEIDDFGVEDDIVDMTQATDDEVLKVFGEMGPEDGIIVTKDSDGTIDLETPDNKYKIIQNDIENEGDIDLDIEQDLAESDYNELGGEKEMEEGKNYPFNGVSKTKSKNSPFDGKTKVSKNAPFDTKNRVRAVSESETEPIYEIDLDGMENEIEEMLSQSEQEMEENKVRVKSNRYRTTGNNKNAGTYTNGKRQTRAARNEGKQLTQYKKLVEAYKKENAEYKKALNDFRTKLTDVAVFNSNLAYATKLFTENSTTKKEKLNILRRFDDVKTLKESKNLFVKIQNELEPDNVITESKRKDVDEVINKTPKSGASTQLHESKIYEDPKFMRSLDIMRKIN